MSENVRVPNWVKILLVKGESGESLIKLERTATNVNANALHVEIFNSSDLVALGISDISKYAILCVDQILTVGGYDYFSSDGDRIDTEGMGIIADPNAPAGYKIDPKWQTSYPRAVIRPSENKITLQGVNHTSENGATLLLRAMLVKIA